MLSRRLVISFPSSDFTFKNNTFIAEMSDFKDREAQLEQLIFYDACDTGFSIRSLKTNMCEVFTSCKTVRVDGEIVSWNFYPLNPKLRAKGVKVVIFND